MKKIIALALITVLSLSLIACGTDSSGDSGSDSSPSDSSSSQAMEPITMKLAHYAAVDHPGGIAAQQFADEVAEKTNGAITIEVYPNNELGAPDEMLEQNIQGVVDMTLGTQGSLDKYSKKFATVMLPFVFDSYEHAYTVLDGPFKDWIENDLLDQGLVYVGSWDYGFRNLTNSVTAINSPADVEGLKIRTPGEIQLQSCMEALGANVQPIAFNELYLSLKQGTVDGQENPLSVIYFNKLYEAQSHLAITNHVYNSMNLVVSQKVWDTLTPEYQEIIMTASENAAATMRDLTQNGEEEYIALLEAEGMQVTYPDTAEFAALMQPSYDAIAEYAGSQEYIDTFLAMVEESR